MNYDSKDVISAHVERAQPEPARSDPIDLLAHDANVYFNVEEEKRVLRKIDMRVLPLMLGAYFLQQLDKSALSYTSVFGIQKDAHLVGRQVSDSTYPWFCGSLGAGAGASALLNPILWLHIESRV